MEPLHTTTTVYSLDEYMKFNRYTVWILNKSLLSSLISIVLLFVLDILLNHKIVGVIAIYVLVTILLSLSIESSAKKCYYSNKSGINEISTYHFFQNTITELREAGTDTFVYNDLYRICETKEHFYLMISQNKGIIIIKRECTPELIAFIQELKRKYNK